MSTVKTHGWFSYDMKVKGGEENTITIIGKGEGGVLSIDLTIDGVTTRHSVSKDGKGEIKHSFVAEPGVDKVTVKIERNSAYMPFIYSVVMN